MSYLEVLSASGRLDSSDPSRPRTRRTEPGSKRGQLKLSLKVTDGTLSVHIIQAKYLSSRWRTTCNPYTQVMLVPDESRKSLCQTDVLYETNHPRFTETFSYELMPEDDRKRLMISVWHQDTIKNCSEFLGCMSFGVKHLAARTSQCEVEGWYYLLSENLGHRKHLVAAMTLAENANAVQPASEHRRPLVGSTVSGVNAKVSSMDSLTMVIHKNHAGYGFTIRGSCPVRVGRVKTGSTSAQAGLRSGDYITRINGQNVSRSRAESVAEIVKKSEGTIVMDVHRRASQPQEPCPMDTSEGDALKPDGVESAGGVQDENLPPRLSARSRPLPELPSGALRPRATLPLQPRGSPARNTPSRCLKSRSLPARVAPGGGELRISPPLLDLSEKYGSGSRSSSKQLNHILNTTYESVRDMHPEGSTTTSCQALPKPGDLSSGDSAYGSHGDQRTAPSSFCTADSGDSIRERKAADPLLTPINELEEARVHDSSVETGREPASYDRWQPDMSIITRASSVRSMFYASMASSPPSSVRGRSPPLYTTQCADESTMGPAGAQSPYTRHINQVSVDCNTLNDFCEDTYQMNTTPEEEHTRLGEERMCSLPHSLAGASLFSSLAPSMASLADEHTLLGDGSVGHVSREPLRSSTPDLPTSSIECMDDSEMSERQAAVCRVLQCEEEFSRLMQVGIQRFSRPLRHCIISPKHHKQLFQNIEKLVALSEYHIRQLIEGSYCAENTRRDSLGGGVSAERAGQVYRPKVRMLCEAYATYNAGLPDALHTLAALQDHPEFSRFTAAPDASDFSLREFLEKPLAHLADLHSNLVGVAEVTVATHQDYSVLHYVLNALEETCAEVLPGYLPEEEEEEEEEAEVTERGSPDSRGRHSPPGTHTNPFLAATVDIQVLELQDKLTFGKGVKPFQLTNSSRHLIFSGDLVFLRDDKCVTLTVTLLSDLLLLSVTERGGTLRVVDEPLLLADIVHTDFFRQHPSEFSLAVEKLNSSGYMGRRPRHYVLRAPDLEQKCAWKSILEHRVKLCKAQDNVVLPGHTELAF